MEPPSRLPISQFSGSTSGRFDVDCGSFSTECFLTKSSTKRLFVFFSHAGRSGTSTQFHRASWSAHLNGTCLYIEDPMYKFHPKLKTGWFYGTNSESWMHTISRIIHQTIKKHDIPESEVIYMGSSSGAYAAIYICDYLGYGRVFAFNPQIRPRHWSDAENFEKITKLSLSNNDHLGRNCLRRISENKKCFFYLMFNTASPVDREQCFPWMDELGIPQKSGVSNYNNLFFLLQEIKYQSPHNSIITADDLIILLSTLQNTDDKNSATTNAYLRRIKTSSEQEDELFCTKFWNKYLHEPKIKELKSPSTINKHYIDFNLKNEFSEIKYRISMQRSKKTVSLLIYISKWNSKNKILASEIASKITNEYSYVFDTNETGDFARVIKKHVKFNEINKNFSDFFNSSFSLIYEAINKKT